MTTALWWMLIVFSPRSKTNQMKLQIKPEILGGGGILILFVVRGRAIFRGTFFKQSRNYQYHFHSFQIFYGIMVIILRNYGYHFTELWLSFYGIMVIILRNYGYHFTELWLSFLGFFYNFRNYTLDIHSICGIMALKFFGIYRIVGTNL